MSDDMRKLELPDQRMVERGMTEAEKAEHRRRMAEWQSDDGEGTEDES